MSVADTPNEKKLKGWHVLLMFLGFFGVMFAVNGVFLYSAITSFPGEDVKKSYLQGLSYNEVLDARAAQSELGWTAEIGMADGEIITRFKDAEGTYIDGLVVTGIARRKATTAMDVELEFQRAAGSQFTVSAAGLEAGAWEVTARASAPGPDRDTLFEARKTIFIP